MKNEGNLFSKVPLTLCKTSVSVELIVVSFVQADDWV